MRFRTPRPRAQAALRAVILLGCLNTSCGTPDVLPPGGEDEQVLGYQPDSPEALATDSNFKLGISAELQADGLTVQFTAWRTDGQALPDGHYVWDLGDGTTGEGVQVKHTYQKAGVYAVALCATIGAGTAGYYYICAEHEVVVQGSDEPGTLTEDSLEIDPLEVAPPNGLTSVGRKGGPFVPASASYTLKNLLNEKLSWTASNTFSWIVLEPSGGELAPGQATVVTISIDAAAADLEPGVYTDMVEFTPILVAGKPAHAKGKGRQVKVVVSAPALVDLADTTVTGVPKVLTLTGSEPDGRDLMFSIVSGPSHGSLGPIDNSAVSSATVTYTPAAGYVGVDSFTFNATNGIAVSDTATFTIDVTPAPPVTIAGQVRAGQAAVSGVTLSATGGLAAVTDASGYFMLAVPSGWSGTITPQHSGYTFSPASRTYTYLDVDMLAQDFTATPIPTGGGGPILIPGPGFTGPTPQPDPVGYDPSLPEDQRPAGWDAKAIARWDVVPFQTFDGEFNVGVVAFHMNGIEKVSFSVNGGPWTDVYEMTLNPQTANHSGIGVQTDGVVEYWATLRAADFADGPVEVRAIAWPKHAGIPRVLAGPLFEEGPYVTYVPTSNFICGEHSLVLHALRGSRGPDVYVRPYTGSVEGDGSQDRPFTRITDAIVAITSKPENKFGRVILIEPGIYEFGPEPSASAIHSTYQDSYVTIRAADGLRNDEVLIRNTFGSISPRQARIKYERVSIDTATNSVKGTVPWFHNVRFFDSIGWTNGENVNVPIIGTYFATECLAENKLYAFPGAMLIRNCHAEKISGDVWQMCRMVIKCSADNIDGTVLPHHTDLYQMWSWMDNVIVYDNIATNMRSVQALFLQPSSGNDGPGELTNSAFVKLDLQVDPIPNGEYNNWGGPPFTQMQGVHRHVLFSEVKLPNQRFLLRTDMVGSGKCEPHNVVISSSLVHWATYDGWVVTGNIPAGVQVEHIERGPQ